MTDLDKNSSGSGRCMVVAIAGLTAGFLATSFIAMARDQSTANAKDVIWARKILMNGIMDNMDKIGALISLDKFDLNAAHAHADNISVMLTAFPHLFPPSTNRWSDNVDLDPVTDTTASPDIWINFADFYRQATAAAKTAHDMSRAETEDEVRRLNRALGIACDTCHALYLKEQ